MNNIIRMIKSVRRGLRTEEFERIRGSVTYTCQKCLISMQVGIARGVVQPDFPFKGDDVFCVPAPKTIDCCPYCGGSMAYDEGSYKEGADGVSEHHPFLRVPSRRASILAAERDVFHAQLVIPIDPLTR